MRDDLQDRVEPDVCVVHVHVAEQVLEEPHHLMIEDELHRAAHIAEGEATDPERRGTTGYGHAEAQRLFAD